MSTRDKHRNANELVVYALESLTKKVTKKLVLISGWSLISKLQTRQIPSADEDHKILKLVEKARKWSLNLLAFYACY